MPPGAMALTAVLCAGPSADASVAIVNLSWQFYQGGLAQENFNSYIVEQQHFNNVAQSELTRTLGGSTFTSVMSISNSALLDLENVVFTSALSMSASATTPADLPEGRAEAFAGLSILDVQFEVTGSPMVYLGQQSLQGDDGPIGDGGLVPPGVYRFLYINPGALDVSVVALPGESFTDQDSTNFRFEFRSIPGPASAVLIPMAGLLAARRRRHA